MVSSNDWRMERSTRQNTEYEPRQLGSWMKDDPLETKCIVQGHAETQLVIIAYDRRKLSL